MLHIHSQRSGLGSLILLGVSLLSTPAIAQQQVPVTVTVTGIQPPASIRNSVPPGSPTNVVNGFGGAGFAATSVRTFNAEVCGGLGDPLQAGFDRFAELTQQRARATSEAERDRLDREIVEVGLRLPQLVTDDFGSRDLALGESQECDDLIETVTELMEQVADYLAALQDTKTAILW